MDRVKQPAFNKSLEFSLPSPERIHANGENEIWFIPSPESETVKIEIIYRAGKYFEKSPGEAQLTLHLLDKGTTGKSANAIAAELDYHGAHLDLKVGDDFASVALYSLKKNLKSVLPILYEITQNPVFPEKEFFQLKKIFIENLRVSLEKNDYIASNLIREVVFGSHPYGKNITIKSIEDINVDKVRTFYGDRFKPFKVFIIGDLNGDTVNSISKIFELVENSIHDLKYTLESSRSVIKKIDGPSKKQASIRIAKTTISRSHPDWPSLQIINHLLGGYFGSRLMKNIREEKGLTYGIHSSIQSKQYSTQINIAAEVNTDKIDLTLEEIQKEMNNLRDIAPQEIEMVKNHFIGSMQCDINTIYSAGDRIKSLILNNLPMEFYQNMILAIDRLDSYDFARIIPAQFNFPDFSIVVVK